VDRADEASGLRAALRRGLVRTSPSASRMSRCGGCGRCWATGSSSRWWRRASPSRTTTKMAPATARSSSSARCRRSPALASVVLDRALPYAEHYASFEALLAAFGDSEDPGWVDLRVPALLAAAGRFDEVAAALDRYQPPRGSGPLARQDRRTAYQLRRWVASRGTDRCSRTGRRRRDSRITCSAVRSRRRDPRRGRATRRSTRCGGRDVATTVASSARCSSTSSRAAG